MWCFGVLSPSLVISPPHLLYFTYRYVICGERTPRPWIGGGIYLEDSRQRCTAVSFNGQGGNPTIQFVGGSPPQSVINIATSDGSLKLRAVDQQYYANATPAVQDLLLVSSLTDPICSKLTQPGNPIDLVLALYDGKYWIHDPRHVRPFSSPYSREILLLVF